MKERIITESGRNKDREYLRQISELQNKVAVKERIITERERDMTIKDREYQSKLAESEKIISKCLDVQQEEKEKKHREGREEDEKTITTLQNLLTEKEEMLAAKERSLERKIQDLKREIEEKERSTREHLHKNNKKLKSKEQEYEALLKIEREKYENLTQECGKESKRRIGLESKLREMQAKVEHYRNEVINIRSLNAATPVRSEEFSADGFMIIPLPTRENVSTKSPSLSPPFPPPPKYTKVSPPPFPPSPRATIITA